MRRRPLRPNRIYPAISGLDLDLTGGRYVALGRGDLSQLLVEKIRGTIELIFDNEIVGL